MGALIVVTDIADKNSDNLVNYWTTGPGNLANHVT